MWSYEGKKGILVELTVPWEEYCEEAEKKDNGSTTCLFPGEVRFLGFPIETVWKLLPKFGVSGQIRKTALKTQQLESVVVKGQNT